VAVVVAGDRNLLAIGAVTLGWSTMSFMSAQ
jgi:hypothetical protein